LTKYLVASKSLPKLRHSGLFFGNARNQIIALIHALWKSVIMFNLMQMEIKADIIAKPTQNKHGHVITILSSNGMASIKPCSGWPFFYLAFFLSTSPSINVVLIVQGNRLPLILFQALFTNKYRKMTTETQPRINHRKIFWKLEVSLASEIMRSIAGPPREIPTYPDNKFIVQ
jgi:hypothetical protein